VSCVANSALITYNAALNRPAYQCSTYRRGNYNYSANLGNDGNPDTCPQSLRENNSWWAVDLGKPTPVYRVDFTNRKCKHLTTCGIVTFWRRLLTCCLSGHFLRFL